MKKLLLILSIPLILTGCFGSDDEGATTNSSIAGMEIYSGRGFSINVPQDWEVIEQGSFTSNIPPETVVAFRNNIKDDVFTANVVVAKDNVEEGLSVSDFAKSSIANAKNSLIAFQEISSEEYTVGEMPSYYAEFEGKKSASDPVIRFRQIFFVNVTEGYTVTAGYLPTEDEGVVSSMQEMLDSFSL